MSKRPESIIQKEKCCYLCKLFYGLHYEQNLEVHHCLNGIGKREPCDRLGLWIWLCPEHHRTGEDAVHRNIAYRQKLKQIAQTVYEKEIGSREEFIQQFGKNYL